MVNLTPRSLVLFGVPFHDVTFEETLAWCVARMRSGPPACLATANVDFLMQATQDPELQRILLEADLVIADGQPIVTLSGKFGPPLRERVTGSDLTPMLAAACAREGFRVFLLGGASGVAEKAAAVLVERNPGLVIAGAYSPPLAGILDMDHADLLARLRAAQPHLLLVAFGAPKQEKFINLHLRTWNIPLAIGIGGTLDFLAGAQTRAPRWVQKSGFEWLWRMGTNPKRLFKRYAGNIGFMGRTLTRVRALQARPAGQPFGNEPGLAWEELDRLVAGADTVPLFNLGARDWLTSEELGRLVEATRRLRARGGHLLVHGGTPRVEHFLRECGLTRYLEYRSTPDQAQARRAELSDDQRAGSVEAGQRCLLLRLPVELSAGQLARWTLRVDAVWQASLRWVAVDASGMTFIDSAGLGWLIALRKRCQEQNIQFSSRGFQGSPRQTLRLTRLESVFDAG